MRFDASLFSSLRLLIYMFGSAFAPDGTGIGVVGQDGSRVFYLAFFIIFVHDHLTKHIHIVVADYYFVL